MRLSQHGVNAQLLTPEDEDIALAERCRRANNIYRHFGKDVLLVSIHCNAKGADGQWHDARGFSAYVGLTRDGAGGFRYRITQWDAAEAEIAGH